MKEKVGACQILRTSPLKWKLEGRPPHSDLFIFLSIVSVIVFWESQTLPITTSDLEAVHIGGAMPCILREVLIFRSSSATLMPLLVLVILLVRELSNHSPRHWIRIFLHWRNTHTFICTHARAHLHACIYIYILALSPALLGHFVYQLL